MTKTYCDRCRDEVPPPKQQKWQVPEMHDDGWHSRTVDLCPKCMAGLAAFIEPRVIVDPAPLRVRRPS